MSIYIGTFDDVVLATSIVAKNKVVSCPNPADASSPVTLHAGGYSKQIGQAADWKHHTETAADEHGAELVEGYWDGDKNAWRIETTADEAAVLEIVRERVKRRDAIAETEQRARREAEFRTHGTQEAMRKEIGLPLDVLPSASLIRINGAVKVMFEGRIIHGGFTVAEDGRPVVSGIKW